MTVIIKESGSLFDEPAEALVNAVNCQGVSGKGVALEFKKRYPEYQAAYEDACARRLVTIGSVYLSHGDGKTKFIISFPTKQGWRDKSMLRYISFGLRDLVKKIEEYGITSIAMPAIGCGEGGLDWVSVQRLIRYRLDPIEWCVVTVFAPGAEKKNAVAETIQNIEETEEVEEKEYEEVSAAECSECGDIILQDDVDFKDQCYECGACGSKYSRENNDGSHRCPDCNKFGSKIDGWCCPNCSDVSESGFETYNQCPDCDGYFLPTDDHTCE